MDNVAFGRFFAGTISVRTAPDGRQTQEAGVLIESLSLVLGGYAAPSTLFADRARYVGVTATAGLVLQRDLAQTHTPWFCLCKPGRARVVRSQQPAANASQAIPGRLLCRMRLLRPDDRNATMRVVRGFTGATYRCRALSLRARPAARR
jgi:hypothetical protein